MKAFLSALIAICVILTFAFLMVKCSENVRENIQKRDLEEQASRIIFRELPSNNGVFLTECFPWEFEKELPKFLESRKKKLLRTERLSEEFGGFLIYTEEIKEEKSEQE